MANNILNRRKLITLAAGSLFAKAAVSATKKQPENSVVSNKITADNNRAKIIIETEQRPSYQHFTNSKPAQLVIDLNNVKNNNALKSLSKNIQAAKSWINNVRIGQKDENTLRIVFDLKRPVKVKASSLKNQLQLDLTTANQANTSAKPANTSKAHRPIIMIDAGHGGKDPGTTGAAGSKEKTIVLATAQELKRQLESKGYAVHMTRSADNFVPLTTRRQHAHSVNADIFLSIHANASDVSNLRGADVFVWGRANSERARKLAQSENGADLVAGLPSVGNKDVDAILTDMMQAQTNADSTRLGNLILRHISRTAKVRKSTVETGDFVVLRSIDVPSALIELGFLSNREEEKQLNSAEFRRKLAVAIANAVQQYLKANNRG
ncbi:N-acetylmuramoyl-L-alanine amidase [Kingella negevensis]|uniref:N-acetylmuramoyl-L-alanine amidase n=1 Tax=Kingella negevensis TaxID=1522312 RepID=A0A238HGU5_9NEIS|nr:N-acetylmuramoyl-L-alanine amidase [Kingella negevensis]MDK4683609.1 N-acetylmuramoyl-L-alanine amidase [Kingella negevensis]MDK4697643.1 N-acetylmuramoyl-L-alanine amidase [Kingella negevensis]MDK4708496.1 N-acetylmuramoyl-L-alanine amidase [Kingella negevensis]MDK4710843.1 N-acetylmuramoyl-L-alanine amidase [Kingella negevensis]SNB75650.1 N-acetylmuramoyl-L-alanine amidase AmiC precursor [Kingella negevensis]